MKRNENFENKPIVASSIKKLEKVFSLPSINKGTIDGPTPRQRRLSKLFKRKMSKFGLQLDIKSKLNTDVIKATRNRYNNDFFATKPLVLKSISKLESYRNPSEISFYAEKENEQLQTSYDMLDQVNTTRKYGRGGGENAKELLKGTQRELAALSNKLSKIVSK